jgi:hypothetical protein
MFAVIWALTSQPVSAEDTARNELTADYYSQTCSSLRHQAQLMHMAGEMFDVAEGDQAKSPWWDRYQALREQYQQQLSVHLTNVAYQSSMGNPPPIGQSCLR